MINLSNFLKEDTGPSNNFRTIKKHNELAAHYDSLPNRDDMNHKKATSEEFSPEENSLTRYTRGSMNINSSLWKIHKNEKLNAEEKEQNITHVPVLDSILEKQKVPKGGLDVYSGLSADPRKIMNSEKIVHHPAYLSTSISKEVASEFTTNSDNENNSHIAHIHLPEGSPGAYIGHASVAPQEREFLLPRGLNLKHLKTTDDGGGQLTHHMEIVNK